MAEAIERTVDDLQRELLAICRGGTFAESWRKVNVLTDGFAFAAWPDLGRELSRARAVRELRLQILRINPHAAIYIGWCPGDDGGHPKEARAALLAAIAGGTTP